MPYTTVAKVKSAIDYPTSNAPVSDAVILQNIIYAQDEINRLTGTVYLNIEDNGTASDGDDESLTDSTKTWLVNAYTDYVAWIYSGTGSGQYAVITSNTATKLEFDELATALDNTSKYRILPNCYKNIKLDGNGQSYIMLPYYPIVSIEDVEIDSTSNTESQFYVYNDTGKIIINNYTGSPSHSYFPKDRPQQITAKYYYGVYPMPAVVDRLCVLLASMMTLTSQISGTYDDFATIQLPELSGSKGQPYINLREVVNNMQDEAKRLISGGLIRKKVYMV